MDYIKLITEEIESHINRIVEQNEQVYKDHDKSYDYKVVNGEWQASKKGQNKFFSLKKYPKAIVILDKKYPEARKQSDTKTTKPVDNNSSKKNEDSKKESNCIPFTIKDSETGNKFRAMVNDKLPSIAKKYDLDREGSYNNSYIKKVWNVNIRFKSGKVMCIGEYFMKLSVSLKPKPNNGIILNPLIDKTKVQSDTIRVKNISSSKKVNNIMNYDGDECAQFVNDFSKGRTVVGDAWLSHDIDGVGKRVFSVYEKVNSSQIEKYKELYKEASSGVDISEKIKTFNEELIGGKKPSGLQLDDVVGIYYPGSPNHMKAFTTAGQRYFVNGDPNKPGKTLNSGRGFSFNTHVGVVGAMKDGQPIVFHNIHGNVISEPAKNLQITWVKRA